MAALKRRWSFSTQARVVTVVLLGLFFALAAYNPYGAMATVMWLTIPALVVGVLVVGRFLVRLCLRHKNS